MLYSSFNEIAQNGLRIFDIVGEKYFAHISDSKKNETLKEHSELVATYLLKLVKSHGLELVVERTIDNLFSSQNISKSKSKKFCKSIFFDSIILHDLGKINPNFQLDRMQNNVFKKLELNQKHYHSFLGSFIFSNYYFEQIINDGTIDEGDKPFLYLFVLLLGNAINSHHSSFFNYQQDFEKTILEESFQFLETYKIILEKDISISFYENIKEILDEIAETANPKVYFTLFSLLKLSYSLLTACDYYATNDYMANMQVDDFGVLTKEQKQKITRNFRTLKSYNAELIENIDRFNELPFSELEDRNKENLNLLRQKLNAEVITNLRKNPDSYWYYIEAPTGAGKTNLSLACISELLQLDSSLNKVFYVFPFTTLITQTYQGIQETIGLTSDEMIQLHSKAGFNSKEKDNDGLYGNEKSIYLDNLFVNFPFCVTSHVRFFDILKGNSKETNYLHHRLCNSIVVIDELQTYNPKHWSKIVYFIENYAKLFNMRFIIMSATLPKIDELSETAKGTFISLSPNKHLYFTNQNFAGRIQFDFSLLEKKMPKDKEEFLTELLSFLYEKGEEYFQKYVKSRILIEFITKNTASIFFNQIIKDNRFAEYKLYLLSGDILEPQRKKVIKELKQEKYNKVILVSTQVVEAGVDIDMDIGFKDRSLLDSDEQLAGRINRNASKQDCKVYLFDCDGTHTIYGKDERYKQQQKNKEIYFGFKEILQNKTFDKLYQKVFEDSIKTDCFDGGKIDAYLSNFKRFDFYNIHKEFQLIEDNQSEQLFIPIEIEQSDEFSSEFLGYLGVLSEIGNKISGEKVFNVYIKIIQNKNSDFISNRIALKKLAGLMAQFTISVYPKMLLVLSDKFDNEKNNYGYKYLAHWQNCYNLETGFDMVSMKTDVFL